MIIVIDAGHGGHDPGAEGNGLMEKDLNLSLAGALYDKLTALGHDARLTRQDDTFWELADRPQAANDAGAAVFVSLHHDASDQPSAHGATVFYHRDAPDDGALAFAIHKAMRPIFDGGMRDRGIGTANYAVLRGAVMPAVLVEGGFVSNAEDAEKIQTAEYQDLLAGCIAEGIESWGAEIACGFAS